MKTGIYAVCYYFRDRAGEAIAGISHIVTRTPAVSSFPMGAFAARLSIIEVNRFVFEYQTGLYRPGIGIPR
jgi:hypothetical protein